MEKIIGPYKISKRTEYSRLRATDMEGNNIEKSITEKIEEDYLKQMEDKDKYFTITGDTLSKYKGRDLQYIFIPDGVRIIDDCVFACSGIHHVHFPNSVKKIGNGSFRNCNGLEEIYLPDTIEEIGDYAFDSCTFLKKVVLPSNITRLPDLMFDHCASLSEIELPDSVETLGNGVFVNCKGLKAINVPKNLKSFGQFPFMDSGIEILNINYNIPAKLRKLETYGDFLVSTNISKIGISKNVKFIDKTLFAFAYGTLPADKKIKEIIYYGTKTEFENFKKNNTELFKSLKKAKINIMENNLSDLLEYDKKSKLIDKIFQITR